MFLGSPLDAEKPYTSTNLQGVTLFIALARYTFMTMRQIRLILWWS